MASIKELQRWWCKKCAEETIHCRLVCIHCGTSRKYVKNFQQFKLKPGFALRNATKKGSETRIASGGKFSAKTESAPSERPRGDTFDVSTAA